MDLTLNNNMSLLSHKHAINPFETYRHLREQSPVTQLDNHDIWFVSRFDDVKYVFDHPQIFSSSGYQVMFAESWISEDCRGTRYISSMDGAEHEVNRRAIKNALAVCFNNGIIDTMNKTAADLVNVIEAGKEVNFIDSFSLPYISTIVREIIGTTEKQPIQEIKGWTDLEGRITPLKPDNDYIIEFETIIRRQNNYFNEAINDRRHTPKKDFLSTLMQEKVDGKHLTGSILRDALALVGAAGYQTAMHALSAIMIALSERKDLQQKLREDKKLIPSFIDELLRYRPPLHNVLRRTTQAVTLAGAEIPQGALVLASIASANHDSCHFNNPALFIPARAKPGHLSFGQGPHKCVGEAIARKELTIALEHLLEAFSFVCPDESGVNWSTSLFMRSTKNLPITFFYNR